MDIRSALLPSLLALLAIACAAPTGAPSASADEEALSKGPPFTQSATDRSCRVVLRAAKVRFDEPPIFDGKGTPWYVVDAVVDVSEKALSDGASLVMQWGPGGTIPSFSRADNDPPNAIAGAPSGFQRFAFRLTHDTIVATGIDPRDLGDVDVALIPLVVFDQQTAFFDHNRIARDGDQYVLFLGQADGARLGSNFTIGDDPRVCR